MNWKKMNNFECLNVKRFFNKNLGSSQRYTAFSLAEVLITLGIIGVVVAMTIPSLVVKNQKVEHVAKVKKIYSNLEQAVMLSENQNGSKSNWDYGTKDFDGNEAVTFANTYLIPYLSVSKNCGVKSGCWATVNNTFSGGTSFYDDATWFAKFVLNDGTAIHVGTYHNNTAIIHFDVNGSKKGPNIYGQDILTCGIKNVGQQSIVVWYIDWPREKMMSDASNGCNKAASQADACLALIMKDGWQIADDYPWK